MAYVLLIWITGLNVVVDTFPNILECKIREAEIQKENPGAQTSCVLMEPYRV